MKNAMINYIKNPKNDELYTPDYAIIPILKYIRNYAFKLDHKLTIWECTDYGKSNITRILKNEGYNVISTHIKNFNFLTDKPTFDFDLIVTNPPYTLKDEFLNKCYEYNKPFMLLLPLTALEGKKRHELYKWFGIELLVFDKRINYMNNKKSCWFNTSWFCWKVLPQQLIFERIVK